MRSPAELAQQLARQWHNSDVRVHRLLSSEPWPLELSIGRPSSRQVLAQTDSVQQHIRSWRQVRAGEVIYEQKRYRGLAAAIEVPIRWRLNNPSQWVQACQDAVVSSEFAFLSQLIAAAEPEPQMHELLVRERILWRNKPIDEVLDTIRLSVCLFPGCADGQPLRLLSGYGVDTKFIERHETLLRRLLDVRYSGAATEQGLMTFLDALDERDHWLLLRPLAEGLLPFRRMRVSTTELERQPLPASRILLVENERCEHLLPCVDDCIAVLGAGLNLGWLSGPALNGKQLAYWGDLDTWGLLMLSRAREMRPDVQALLMKADVFTEYAERAVPEAKIARETAPAGLTEAETALYGYLQGQVRGRLEQEFIPLERVHAEIKRLLSAN